MTRTRRHPSPAASRPCRAPLAPDAPSALATGSPRAVSRQTWRCHTTASRRRPHGRQCRVPPKRTRSRRRRCPSPAQSTQPRVSPGRPQAASRTPSDPRRPGYLSRSHLMHRLSTSAMPRGPQWPSIPPLERQISAPRMRGLPTWPLQPRRARQRSALCVVHAWEGYERAGFRGRLQVGTQSLSCGCEHVAATTPIPRHRYMVVERPVPEWTSICASRTPRVADPWSSVLHAGTGPDPEP